MLKIVLLQSMYQTNRIFSENTLNILREMGEVKINYDRENPESERVMELIKDADVAVTSWGCPALDTKILDRALSLKAVLHAAGSIKGIVTPELIKRGIRVTNAAKVLGKGVAETALGLTIASIKNMWILVRNTENGEWLKGRDKVKEPYDITIGVIGGGYAGRHYIKLLQNFDVDILLYDPIIDKERAQALGAEKVGFEELLKKCDVVSIHAPSIPATHHMFNKKSLGMMKDDAVLINTARGTIIDESALIEELNKGRLFACLDVTDPEPPAKDNPLRKLPNVILTPHIAGSVNNGVLRVGNYIVEELQRYIDGQKMESEVDLSRLNIIA